MQEIKQIQANRSKSDVIDCIIGKNKQNNLFNFSKLSNISSFSSKNKLIINIGIAKEERKESSKFVKMEKQFHEQNS